MTADPFDVDAVNRSTSLARVVVDELIRGGVREAVLCPGSRNAPLSYALHAADAAGRLRLHVRVDERSAGFLALGLALASGAPVPVATTSGTAVANLHPAVLEASHAGVALLVLSADRPGELLGSGANQTVDQRGLFGGAVRAAVVLAGDAPARWRSTVCRVLAAATGARTGDPGPVQLDVPFTEPLMPDGAGWPAGRADGQPWTRVSTATVDAPVELDVGIPTLVVAGAGSTVTVNLPTVAEPGALAPAHPVHPLALGALAPEQVLVLGRPTLHRDVARLLGSGVPVHVVGAGSGWADVAATATTAGTRAVLSGASPDGWFNTCATASVLAATAVDQVLDAETETTGLHVARAVARGLTSGDLLVLGSSNPVRDASLTGLPAPGVRVLTNRGVAGIDGTVSTALGAALSHRGRAFALLGDLTFLHDSGGLLLGPREPRPDLTIVVANDNGGGIFATLEQGAPDRAEAFDRVFGTPHGTDLAALCAAHGVPHARVSVAELGSYLAAAPSGLRVLEVGTSRCDLRGVHARLRSAAPS